MTITSTTRKAGPFIGNGAMVSFPFPFKVFTPGDLLVVQAVVSTGVETVLVLTAGYSVTLNADQNTSPGGSVRLPSALPVGQTLTLITALPNTQGMDLTNQGGFYPKVINDAVDRAVILIQQLAEKVSRTLQFGVSSASGSSSLIPGARAGGFLAFDAGGNPVIASGTGNDAALRTDLANSGGASLVSVPVNVPVVVPYLQTLSDIIQGSEISLFRFISSDQHAGIRANTNTNDQSLAMTTAAAAAKSVFLPAGTYATSGGAVLGEGAVWRGVGRNATILKALNPAATLITASGYGSGVRAMRFDALVPQTGGSYLVLSGTESFIDDFFMNGDFNGILLTGNVARVRHGRFQDGASGAIRIKAEGGDNSQVISDVLMGAQTPANIVAAGIRVRNSSALMIQNVSVIQQGVGLLIDPQVATDNVFSLYVDTCFFDNGTRGIRILPMGSGSVLRSRFVNVWASSSSGDGVEMAAVGTGSITGMHFESMHAVLNGGSGMSIGAGCADISVNGGEFCQNAYGIYNTAPTTKLKILNATIGIGAGLAGNANGGVVLASGTDQYIISDNLIVGNGGQPIAGGSTGSFKAIVNNVTGNTVTQTTLAPTASPFSYINSSGSTQIAYINGGTVSLVSIGGFSVFQQTNCSVTIPQGQTLQVTYSVVPGIGLTTL